MAISASSRLASVAVLTEAGEIRMALEEDAPRNASGACLHMMSRLREAGLLKDVRAFAADTGPGSFIGARVGVTLAKTLAFARGVGCYGSSSFDLISPSASVAIPNRKGEWLIRLPGEEPRVTRTLPADCVGYGEGIAEQVFPNAFRFAGLIAGLTIIPPERLLPTYVVDPSISKPRVPYREGAV